MKLPQGQGRRGFSLIWVLVLLMVASAVSVELTRQIGMARQQAIATEQALQAEWLARAGLVWGASQLVEKGEAAPLGKLPGDRWPGDCLVKLLPGKDGVRVLEAQAVTGVSPNPRKCTMRQEWMLPSDIKLKPVAKGPIRRMDLGPR